MPERPPDSNGRFFRLPPIPWPTVVSGILFLTLMGQSWLVYQSLGEWEAARESQRAIAIRMAQREQNQAAAFTTQLNALRLNVLSNIVDTPEDRRRLALYIFQRLDVETRKDVLSLKLRALKAIGEQEAPPEIDRRRD